MDTYNSGVDILTLDSSTAPTSLEFAMIPSAAILGEYTWEVYASSPSDPTISALYQITMTVIDPCTIAIFDPGLI